MSPGGTDRRVKLWHLVLCAAIVAVMAAILLAMGRVPICACGTIKLWHGTVASSENSQHLSDWYSPSHFIHGLLFYAGFWWLARRHPMGLRLVGAVLIEAIWELTENTDAVIQRYREATIALDYFGDSVLNSVSDVAFMMVGFAFASRLPVFVSVAVALGLEILTAVLIRDNLTLNVLMLLYPLDAVRAWQGGL
ncbi:DUF2585 domain-containing protein [Aureimonas sp. AU12]|uniref:DUF2585 domain-containing protein n=1 Tax=Aureimonas sp. AU12 TaxID=1638161 RepID=UPI0009ECB530|nr:DUF2585 domain-containing protein [Aureimonas sp. AU12]